MRVNSPQKRTFKIENKINIMERRCLYCGEIVPKSTRKQRKYCSERCGQCYRLRLQHKVRFTKIPKIDWKRVQELVSYGCTLAAIQEKLYPIWKTRDRLEERVRIEGIKIKRPDFYIQKPVDQVLKFHKLKHDIREGKLSVSDVAKRLQWDRKIVRRILNKMGIEIPKEIKGRHAILIKPYDDNDKKLTKSDKLIAEKVKTKGNLYRLYGAGCDFLLKSNGKNILIEAKSAASKYNISIGIFSWFMQGIYL